MRRPLSTIIPLPLLLFLFFSVKFSFSQCAYFYSNYLENIDAYNVAFTDIDNDGDQDAFLGNEHGTIYSYKNIDSSTSPMFSKQSGSSDPFDGVVVDFNSTPSFVDIDNDGDQDVFIGELYGNIDYYKNIGSSTSPMFSKQSGSSNPLNGVTGSLNTAPSFVDIDNDGDLDAVIGEDYGTIYYYKNTGSSTSPAFSKQSGSSDPFDGVDVGSHSAPSFVDIDNDGDQDAFIGNGDGIINYYKNIGSSTSAVFSLTSGSSNPFNGDDVGVWSTPSFVDIDNDGDQDAFIGEYDGIINYYKNTGNSTSSVFSLKSGSSNPFNVINAAYSSATSLIISFVDIDNDGDQDAFIGEYDGIINYYKNKGSSTSPMFNLQSGSNNPFDGVDVGSYSAPYFVDVDNDGDQDAFIGQGGGGIINYYKNTGSSTSAVFSLTSGTSNPFNGVNVGDLSTPSLVDIDNDGDQDAFIGEKDGIINYYKNTGTSASPVFSKQSGSNDPFDGIDIDNNSAISFVDIDNDGDQDAFMGEYYGTSIYYYKNTGSSTSPVFSLQSGSSNLFYGVDVGDYGAPAFVDIDNDGDQDVFMGGTEGDIDFVMNFCIVLTNTNSVWPGDANSDLIANNFDLLNIGLAYGVTGAARINASNTWAAQFSADWGNIFIDSTDYKHADCNGDGSINDDDTLAIHLNYGLTHNKTILTNNASATDPALYLVATQDTISTTKTAKVEIYLGTSSLIADSVYGIAFSIYYDAINIDSGSVKIDYSSSWIGDKTNALSLYKDLYSNGKVDLAFTRKDMQNISGYGLIGEMSCVLEDNLSGKDTIYKALTFTIGDVKIISNDESEIMVTTISDSIIAVGPAGIFEENLSEMAFQLFPNPANEMVQIKFPFATSYSVTMRNYLGQKLIEVHTQNEPSLSINTQGLAAGSYFVEVFTKDYKFRNIKKLIIVDSK